MKLRRQPKKPSRRGPRGEAFRSTDLTSQLRLRLDPWFTQQGFRRLGAQAWTRPHLDKHLIIAVQCSQGGWDRSAGNKFVVEFELSDVRKRASGFHRDRIWRLLTDDERAEALRLCDSIASTLPAPDQSFVAALPENVRDHYLRVFAPTDKTPSSSDVWFRYYDEDDADRWGEFLARTIAPALRTFLAQPPSLFGHRPGAADQSD